MKNISKNTMVLLFVTLTFSSAIVSCSFSLPDREYEKVVQDQFFSFDPKLTIASLREGKAAIFTPINTTVEPLPASDAEPITWHQADYFKIAEAIHKFVWGESLDGWELYKMDFSLRCNVSGLGFETGNFEFFKVIKDTEGEKRIKHQIDIDATVHSIFISESEYKPMLVDWETLDTLNMKITADDALEIADTNDGRQKRLAIQNDCSIHVFLAPNQWLVRYNDYENPQAIFRIEINSVTGEYRK